MFRNIFRINSMASALPLWKNDVRSFNTRKLRRSIKQFFGLKDVKPPYFHITQVGDPVLRAPSLPVEPQTIPLLPFQIVLSNIQVVMNKFDSFGLAAAQIGLPWQIFAIQVTEKQLQSMDEDIRRIQGMKVVPYQIFINPVMKTLNHKLLSFPEACGSIRGFSAVVPRAQAVEISALNEKGEEVTVSFEDYAARIVQHEMDHIKGILYTDKMYRRTFTCTCWHEVNVYGGKMEIRYDQ